MTEENKTPGPVLLKDFRVNAVTGVLAHDAASTPTGNEPAIVWAEKLPNGLLPDPAYC